MLTLVILAAGAGSRYGGLKQLAPVGPSGEALLEYSAYDAVRAGFPRAVVVVRPQDEAAFRERFDAGLARRLALAYVHQTVDDLPPGCAPRPDRTHPWGTGQAVLAAQAEVTGGFAVVNADDFYGAGTFHSLAGFLRRSRPDTLAVVGFRVEDTLSEAGPVSRALCRLDDEGLLLDIVELQAWRQNGQIVSHDAGGEGELGDRAPLLLRGDELVSMNGWGLTRDLFAELRRLFRTFLADSDQLDDELRLPDVAQALIRDCRFRVEVVPGSGPWCGITFRQDQQRAAAVLSELVSQGHYPRQLWA